MTNFRSSLLILMVATIVGACGKEDSSYTSPLPNVTVTPPVNDGTQDPKPIPKPSECSLVGTATTGGALSVEFIFGSHLEATSQTLPGRYVTLTECKTPVLEDFNDKSVNSYTLITNKGFQELYYELNHGTEKNTITSGAVQMADFLTSKMYKFVVESPLSQDNTTGKDAGVDSLTANTNTRDVLVWSFSKPISYFGAQLVDVESSVDQPAKLRLFDCEEKLIREESVLYPNLENGQKELHFVGFASAQKNVCHITLTVGDYAEKILPSYGNSRALGLDDFWYGE